MKALDTRLREAEQEVENQGQSAQAGSKNTWLPFKARVSKRVWSNSGPNWPINKAKSN